MLSAVSRNPNSPTHSFREAHNVGQEAFLAADLFGNEAGEDEDPAILNSYFVEKPEFKQFYSAKSKFGVVRARKGIGKSALLKKSETEGRKDDPESIVIYVKGSDLMALQPLSATSPNEMIYGWQQRICSRINLEVGSRLKLAFSDDAITLVESAELAGFKDRNIVSSLIDRMRGKFGKLELTKISSADPNALLKRFSGRTDHYVSLFVDDIDATFINTEVERLHVSTFFSACRNLVANVKGLIIRASVRTDVWAIIRQFDEALDKCEQYMLDLKWSNKESEMILCKKILSYFQRAYPESDYFRSLEIGNDNREILGLIFTSNFRWGARTVPPDRPIYILSNGRPRWAAQLCKMAATVAYKRNGDKIGISDVSGVLRPYGQARVDDLYKEHRHQMENLDRLIESFSGEHSRYTTDELLALITRKIVKQHGLPELDGRTASTVLQVANFLYRMGFIYGRDEHDQSGLSFVRYEDRPNLLLTRVNRDDNLVWEVHPSYRQVLRIS